MRMYWAKQRASEPFSTGCSAISHVGTATFSRPASFIATAIAVGFMSAEPTICSAATSSLTVLRALMLMMSAPMPKAIMSVPAMIPPISRILRPVMCSYLPIVLLSPTSNGGTGCSVPCSRPAGIGANHASATAGTRRACAGNY